MTEYFVEQVNVSDDEYTLIDMNYKSGCYVEKNKPIFSYESSKTIHEATATGAGYLYFNPGCKLDENYSIGYKLAIQSLDEISADILNEYFVEQDASGESEHTDVKISKKAKKLIDKHGLSVAKFSGYEIISEQIVSDYITRLSPAINNLETYAKVNSQRGFFSSNKVRLVIVGAGKAALQLYDSLMDSEKYEIVKFYDSDSSSSQTSLFGFDIVRGELVANILRDHSEDHFDECIISFSGNTLAREALFLKLKSKGIKFANIIHSTAYISKLCEIGEGNLIFANVRLGPFCSLGDNNVVSALCNIEHNNIIGSHNTFGPGVLFSGSCTVGDTNKFGTMVGVEPNVKIGSNNIIASSQVLSSSLGDSKLIRLKASSEIKDI